MAVKICMKIFMHIFSVNKETPNQPYIILSLLIHVTDFSCVNCHSVFNQIKNPSCIKNSICACCLVCPYANNDE